MCAEVKATSQVLLIEMVHYRRSLCGAMDRFLIWGLRVRVQPRVMLFPCNLTDIQIMVHPMFPTLRRITRGPVTRGGIKTFTWASSHLSSLKTFTWANHLSSPGAAPNSPVCVSWVFSGNVSSPPFFCHKRGLHQDMFIHMNIKTLSSRVGKNGVYFF